MDAVDVIGIGLSVVGIGLSIWAMVIADNATKAVKKVIEKNNDLASRDDARDLLSTLGNARDAALGRRGTASRMASAGRSAQADVHTLRLAQDALATVTLGENEVLVSELRVAANELESALSAISTNTGDGWSSALVILQGVIPKVDLLQRSLVTKTLTA